jgi:hypothetical protein
MYRGVLVYVLQLQSHLHGWHGCDGDYHCLVEEGFLCRVGEDSVVSYGPLKLHLISHMVPIYIWYIYMVAHIWLPISLKSIVSSVLSWGRKSSDGSQA